MERKRLVTALLGVILTFSALGRDRDLGANLIALQKNGSHEAALIQRLRRYHVVFVPGFLSEYPKKFHWLVAPFTLPGEHFAEQMDWLTARGVENHRAAVNTEGLARYNGISLALDLRGIEKPVLLVTHSKGGIDALHMLVDWPSTQRKVAGWIAFQSPFHGTPVADLVVRSLLRGVAYPLLDWVGGTPGTLEELTTAEAEHWLAEKAPDIDAILGKIPVVSVASDMGDRGADKRLRQVHRWMMKRGIPNDGVVPRDSARLPGADFVSLEGVDHRAPVGDGRKGHFPRVELTEALLEVLFAVNGGL